MATKAFIDSSSWVLRNDRENTGVTDPCLTAILRNITLSSSGLDLSEDDLHHDQEAEDAEAEANP